jgi:hypothetical protein
MRFLLSRAVSPELSLAQALRAWNQLANELREAPRTRRYQHDSIRQFLS